MIIRLLIFLFVLATPGAALAAMVYFGIVKPKLRIASANRMGLLHANRTCNNPDCFAAIDPEDKDSVFIAGKWWHRHCMKELIA